MSVVSVTEKADGLFKQLWLKKSQFVVTVAWQKHVIQFTRGHWCFGEQGSW